MWGESRSLHGSERPKQKKSAGGPMEKLLQALQDDLT